MSGPLVPEQAVRAVAEQSRGGPRCSESPDFPGQERRLGINRSIKVRLAAFAVAAAIPRRREASTPSAHGRPAFAGNIPNPFPPRRPPLPP